jgi:outer membrane protein
MKTKFISFIISFFLLFSSQIAIGANLLEVYRQAFVSDPTYRQSIAQSLSTKEGLPINFSALLPSLTGNINPSVKRSGYSGANLTPGNPRNTTTRGYTMALTLNQTVFNAAQYFAVAGAVSTARGAQATLNASLQNLMIRVASAYFTVLKDEDTLAYNEASKLSFAEQLDQVKQQYQVGLKTITDVYTAQASYDSAVASYIAAQTTLANDRENLRVITGVYYPELDSLSDAFPLVTPKPNNVEAWVKTAQQQNWSIKAAQYAVSAGLQTVRQQFAGHIPTVSLEGTVDRIYSNNTNSTNAISRSGAASETDKSIALNLTIPILAGGAVVAQTNQATYNYQATQQSLEQTVRNTVNTTRQSYRNVISGISQIAADQQAIKSNISSLEGMEASYRVGTETLVNVLDQQQKLFQAQTQYATDRYAYVNNILLLKQAAGTLSFDDLRALNAWLMKKSKRKATRHVAKRKNQPVIEY